MAVNPRSSTELLIPKKQNETSPDPRSKISSQSTYCNISSDGKQLVPVIYYLSRNGQLEHPHFIQVPLSSSSHGLYLRDVINRLISLRGNGMAYMYSWSSKRSYKSGYVWQDLSEDDLIQPTNGHDYILKASEMLQAARSFRSKHHETTSSPNETQESSINSRIRKKNQSWSSFENSTNNPKEYRVHKCESSRELGGERLAGVVTHTDEKNRRSMSLREEYGSKSVELSREDLSPPVSMSSSEGLVSASGSGVIDRCGTNINIDRTATNAGTSGRMKATRVLMQLITCGWTVSAKDRGWIDNKKRYGMRMQYGSRIVHQ